MWCGVTLCNSGYTHLASHTKTLSTEPALNRYVRNNWCAGWRFAGETERACGRRLAAGGCKQRLGRTGAFNYLQAASCVVQEAGVDSLREGVMSVSPSHPAKHKHSCTKASAILLVQSFWLHSCLSFVLCSAGQFLGVKEEKVKPPTPFFFFIGNDSVEVPFLFPFVCWTVSWNVSRSRLQSGNAPAIRKLMTIDGCSDGKVFAVFI